jgi:predicted nuclease of predicted toxin-antitoxin system
MKFKLDENFGSRSSHLFAAAGYDAQTVRQEELSGASDLTIFEVCQRENRCLVTLDLDFADVVRFPAGNTSGIAVLRLPKSASLRLLEKMVSDLLSVLRTSPITGQLWIVEAARIRVHEDAAQPTEE